MKIEHRTLKINLIAAMGENRVIGVGGGLPWRLPDEMKHFVRVTRGHTVVMGRRTFESVGCKPLPNRLNIVLTRDACYAVPAGVKKAANVAEAVELAAATPPPPDMTPHPGMPARPETVSDTVLESAYITGSDPVSSGVSSGEVFICGGERAYREALPMADALYLTVVHASPEGDAWFPAFDLSRWKLTDESRHGADDRHAFAFTFRRYERLR